MYFMYPELLAGATPEREASQVSLVVKHLPASAGNVRDVGFDPWVGKIPWRRGWQPTQVFLPRECHGQRSLAGHSAWARTQSDTPEVTLHAHLGGRTLCTFALLHLPVLSPLLAARLPS